MYEDNCDNKKSNYKSNKESKKSRISRSQSSDRISDIKVKAESNKEKVKDKKLKKKSKKCDKEKDKKKRKRQKHSFDEENKDNESKRNVEEKRTKQSKYSEELDEQGQGKDKCVKLEPFKVKESSNLKSQINFLNSSNIFTKDEWQKESSDDDLHKKNESNNDKKNKPASQDVAVVNPVKSEPETVKETVVKKEKSEEKDSDRERKKRHHPASHSKVRENNLRSSNHRDADDNNKSHVKTNENASRKERSHSVKTGDGAKGSDRKDKVKSKDHKNPQRSCDDKKKVEDIFEDERIELPRTPTDAQYTGLFARLQEESVSDTEIEEILPPILLDDHMKALLVNDPNVIQEAWDSEDDVLLAKKENIVAPKHRGVLETLAVPWKILIDEATLNKHKQVVLRLIPCEIIWL